jgi:cephalosporin-C deacetylase-like acetyl esterase
MFPFIAALVLTLPGTQPLTETGDLWVKMLEGIERYLDRALTTLKPAPTSPETIKTLIGAVDPRLKFSDLETKPYSTNVQTARWPVLKGMDAEGLLVTPKQPPTEYLIAIPDAGMSPEALAARLNQPSSEILIPLIIDRNSTFSGNPRIKMTNQSHREYIYRMAYQAGRHIVGYEVQKVLAAVDYFSQATPRLPIRIIGYGEGAIIARYAAFIDSRITATELFDYPDLHIPLWQQLIDRNIWSILKQRMPAPVSKPAPPSANHPIPELPAEQASARMHRQFDQMVEYTQTLIRNSPLRRREFWGKADSSSIERWQTTTDPYRKYFHEEIIGKLPDPTEPMIARTRRVYDNAQFTGYEVVLPVWQDVFASGILLVPKNLRPGERRPLVVTQHGLAGQPKDVIEATDPKAEGYYHNFAAKLAAKGYIVYAPQNPYIGNERFRLIVRRANPLKLTLFSFITGQHQRSVDWLSQLPFVDPGRIGFYGLSYGGKTAMRVPPLLNKYKVVICSGDFNEWIWKTTSVEEPFSYVFTYEYEIGEFNLANTYNYAELAGMIAPRPFMVERGHNDQVGIDEWVAYEYAKVRRFYSFLGIPDRTAIEFFQGPHTIHGVGTFEFLDKHLRP